MNKYFFCIKIENIIIHDLAENKQNLVIIMQIPNINLITITNMLIRMEGEEWGRKQYKAAKSSSAIKESQQCLETAVQKYEGKYQNEQLEKLQELASRKQDEDEKDKSKGRLVCFLVKHFKCPHL